MVNQEVIEYVSAKSQKKIEKRQLQEATQKANRKRGAHIHKKTAKEPNAMTTKNSKNANATANTNTNKRRQREDDNMYEMKYGVTTTEYFSTRIETGTRRSRECQRDKDKNHIQLKRKIYKDFNKKRESLR
ncbi:hypothetical protein RUM43_006465 [Polyplax serrata]|uniref:Uncharacterized protein n=1 Tax=Polyplax serrata TaxID=468196 RepID=A0AAN8PF11_POLSC